MNKKTRKIVTLYRRKHFSCFLYLGSILVDIYGTEEGFKSGLIEMMQVSKQEELKFAVFETKLVIFFTKNSRSLQMKRFSS